MKGGGERWGGGGGGGGEEEGKGERGEWRMRVGTVREGGRHEGQGLVNGSEEVRGLTLKHAM